MANSDFLSALPLTGQANKALLRDALVKRVIYPFFDGEDPTGWTAVVNGALPAAIANSSGGIFFYDATDETSAHDGVVVIVTADGKRYKTSNMTMPDSVKGIGVDMPTGAEEIGDAYITSSAPDGEFAYNPDQIAVLTVRDWLFIEPRVGRPIYVEGDRHYFLDSNGVWRPFFEQAAGLIRDQALVGGQRRYIVQNQTTDNPPGSPSPGVYWIVGGSPTGAWAGFTGYIATFYDGDTEWTLIPPKAGDEAYDIASSSNFIFNGSTWGSSAGAWGRYARVRTAGTGSTSSAGSTYLSNFGSLPIATATTTNARLIDDAGISAYAAPTGRRLRFSYRADITPNPVFSSGTGDTNNVPLFLTLALYRDTDTNSLAQIIIPGPAVAISDAASPYLRGPYSVCAQLTIVTDDSSAHTYKMALVGGRAKAGTETFTLTASTIANREFTVEESFD